MSTNLSARMLRLLSLLQSKREWSGADLADRLGVTGRTVRRDIERLRGLGYPVDGTTGIAGGYRLASGKNMPPLLLDDSEAVATAAALLTAAGGTVTGIEETSLRALAKLEQVLPARLRPRVSAIAGATTSVGHRAKPRIDADTLAVLGAACRDHEVVRFEYRRRDAAAGSRQVEPHHVITGYDLWYLIAFDLARGDWRTFRIDRLTRPFPTGRRFEPRELPAPDAATYLGRTLADTPYRYRARATVHAPAEVVEERLSAPLPGRVRPSGEHTCTVSFGSDTVDGVTRDVLAIATLRVEFTLDGPPELLEHLHSVAVTVMRATGAQC